MTETVEGRQLFGFLAGLRWKISRSTTRHVLKLIGTAILVDTLTKRLTSVLDLDFNFVDLDLHLGNFRLQSSQHQSRRE
jgi:hypothetical protein